MFFLLPFTFLFSMVAVATVTGRVAFTIRDGHEDTSYRLRHQALLLTKSWSISTSTSRVCAVSNCTPANAVKQQYRRQ